MPVLRLAAAAAALVLAVLSRGDALVLAAVLAVAAWRPLPVAALAAAVVATSWRWGASSLEALAGAQAALGPAGWVGPSTAAASSWLAALAIVLSATRPHGRPRRGTGSPDADAAERFGPVVLALAAGASAAVVVAGPAPGGSLTVRMVGGITAVVASLLVSVARGRDARAGALLDAAAVVAGLGALALAPLDAGGWSGTVSASAMGEGLAIAVAAAVPVGVVLMAWARRPSAL